MGMVADSPSPVKGHKQGHHLGPRAFYYHIGKKMLTMGTFQNYDNYVLSLVSPTMLEAGKPSLCPVLTLRSPVSRMRFCHIAHGLCTLALGMPVSPFLVLSVAISLLSLLGNHRLCASGDMALVSMRGSFSFALGVWPTHPDPGLPKQCVIFSSSCCPFCLYKHLSEEFTVITFWG